MNCFSHLFAYKWISCKSDWWERLEVGEIPVWCMRCNRTLCNSHAPIWLWFSIVIASNCINMAHSNNILSERGLAPYVFSLSSDFRFCDEECEQLLDVVSDSTLRTKFLWPFLSKSWVSFNRRLRKKENIFHLQLFICVHRGFSGCEQNRTQKWTGLSRRWKPATLQHLISKPGPL